MSSVIPLKYGRHTVFLHTQDVQNGSLLRISTPAAASSEEDITRYILDHPIQSHHLTKFLSPSDTLAVIVSDKTRLCRTQIFLPVILDQIQRAGVAHENISIVFATGTHPPQSEREKRSIVGDSIYDSYRIIEHDSRKESGMEFIGTTRFGTDVKINRTVARANKIIATGTIVHHYFAGFGGGAKLLMPGVAAYSTALENHKRTLTERGEFHPNCRDGVVENNPVYEDIVDALRYYPPVFYVAVLLNEEGKIFNGVCGDLKAAHHVGAEKVNACYRIPITSKADLVIVSAGGYPNDINFIQSHKSIHHASYAVQNGGVIICLAACADGIGNASFPDWFRYTSDEEMRHALLEHYTMNGHTALSLRNKTRNVRIIFVGALPDEDVELMGMMPAKNLPDALMIAKGFLPMHYTSYIIENGAQCVPYVVE